MGGIPASGVFEATGTVDYQVVTDANGKAEAVVILSRQPGNNFKVAGAFDKMVRDGLHIKEGTQEQALRVWTGDNKRVPERNEPDIQPVVRATELLTVWRRLHVEVDSMGVVTGNTITGQITNVVDNRDGTSTCTTNQNLDDSIDRFNPGRLTDSANRDFSVIANTNGNNFTITVNDYADGTRPSLGNFKLVDDDELRDGQDVPMPDTSKLANAMREAYVQVLFYVGDNNDNVPFILNVAYFEEDVRDAQDWDSVGFNSADFWVTYILGACQGKREGDNDPDDETFLTLGVTSRYGGSLIFIETIKDYSREEGLNAAKEEQGTVVHEVGHAVARSSQEPVTLFDQDQNLPIRYTSEYIALIRTTTMPYTR